MCPFLTAWRSGTKQARWSRGVFSWENEGRKRPVERYDTHKKIDMHQKNSVTKGPRLSKKSNDRFFPGTHTVMIIFMLGYFIWEGSRLSRGKLTCHRWRNRHTDKTAKIAETAAQQSPKPCFPLFSRYFKLGSSLIRGKCWFTLFCRYFTKIAKIEWMFRSSVFDNSHSSMGHSANEKVGCQVYHLMSDKLLLSVCGSLI